MEGIATGIMATALLQDAYHYALAAAGGSVDDVQSLFPQRTRGGRYDHEPTRAEYLRRAHRKAKEGGLEVISPKRLADAAELARSILAQAKYLGIDAYEGTEIQTHRDLAKPGAAKVGFSFCGGCGREIEGAKVKHPETDVPFHPCCLEPSRAKRPADPAQRRFRDRLSGFTNREDARTPTTTYDDGKFVRTALVVGEGEYGSVDVVCARTGKRLCQLNVFYEPKAADGAEDALMVDVIDVEKRYPARRALVFSRTKGRSHINVPEDGNLVGVDFRRPA